MGGVPFIIEVKVLGSFGRCLLSFNWQPNYYHTVTDIQSVIFFHQLSQLQVIKTVMDRGSKEMWVKCDRTFHLFGFA